MATTLEQNIANTREVLFKSDKLGTGSFTFAELEPWIDFKLEKAVQDAIAGSGGESKKLRSVTEEDAIDNDDRIVFCNGTFELSLPDPNDFYDSENGTSIALYLKNVGVGVVTLIPENGETVEEDTMNAGEALTLVTDGTNWYVI